MHAPRQQQPKENLSKFRQTTGIRIRNNLIGKEILG
jgi:hypothetical protein